MEKRIRKNTQDSPNTKHAQKGENYHNLLHESIKVNRR